MKIPLLRHAPTRAGIGTAAALLALAAAAAALLTLQTAPLQWSDPGAERITGAAAAIALYLGGCAVLAWRRYRHRQYLLGPAAEDGSQPLLVAFASQTGFAERLAGQTAAALRSAGLQVQVEPLANIKPVRLAGTRRALFVVSTTGDGDAPDSAAGFVRRVLGQNADLSGLRYGVLAIGDRQYPHFCAFGHALENWLRHQGAAPLFDTVEVDNADDGALRHWQHHLGVLSGSTDQPDWSTPRYRRWQLSERRLLNPGSPGAPAFLLRLHPLDNGLDWQPGDIAEIGPRNAPAQVLQLLSNLALNGEARVGHTQETLSALLARSRLPHDSVALAAWHGFTPEQIAERLQALPHREYSIASLPADGALELIVRRMQHPDGRPGLGSGWLTEYADSGADIALRVRANSGFRPPVDARPLILIGNGTGLAGLRAHLKARAARGHYRNWLLFGERTRAHDFFLREDIENWCAAGVIQRLDLAFSRDQDQRIYVQQRLREAAAELTAWVSEGAAIYVCGSLEGMAPAVDQVLRETLGADRLEQMAEDGRYRRDVY